MLEDQASSREESILGLGERSFMYGNNQITDGA
jgi:hypothetical protein